MDLQIFNRLNLLKICNIGVFGRIYVAEDRDCKIPNLLVQIVNLHQPHSLKTQTFPDDIPAIQKMESSDRRKAAEFVYLQTV